MGSFLSVTRGSDEPPVLLEMHYEGPGHLPGGPVVFVGKGITFDRWTTLMPKAGSSWLMHSAMRTPSTLRWSSTLPPSLTPSASSAVCPRAPAQRPSSHWQRSSVLQHRAPMLLHMHLAVAYARRCNQTHHYQLSSPHVSSVSSAESM
ncbi:hypothetical protein V5799_023904 [Amblyomma americanum]|uniref:Cytosol aminopeptidase domain-containing protein n=1 Tax=Amblyomma americanum TaxID=6943 RepID=A0AAQ4FHN1_AMBAM